MSVNSGLQATKIIGQREAFCRQRIPEFSRVRKETVDIDILVTPRNGDRKIMKSITITSRPPSRKRKWNHLDEVYHQSFRVNRLLVFIGARVLIGALKLRNTIGNNFKAKAT